MNFCSDPGVLVKSPLTNFQKALELLDKHTKKLYHKAAVVDYEEFVKVMTNKQPSIQQQLRIISQETIANNCKKLRSILETIILCGRQNIPLRGHCDSSLDLERDLNASHGNFWSLLQFRVSAGDTTLRDHLEKAPRNAMYTSPDIQNQVIDILGDHVQQKILSKVRAAQFFTVMADEVTDCSNKEQLSLVIRYVSPDDHQIREDLVDFIECDTGTSGRALAEKITTFFDAHGLNGANLRGQAYDGAGNMSGKTNGAAAIITSKYPQALYLHCSSHCLNLAVVKSLDVTSVRNMIGVVNRVSTFFFAHPKRQSKLEEAIQNTQPESKVHKLKDLCRTRWVERIDAIDRFSDLHPSIVSCFESIASEGSTKWTPDSLTDANTLLLAISTTDFISALVIANKCLSYLLALTRSLQAEAKDIVQAVSEIDNLMSVLLDVRENVETHHSTWFTEVEKKCEAVGTEPSLPRLCGRQSHRSNTPAQTPSEYYRRTITIPVLDHLLSEMKSRFSEHQKTSLLGLYLVPSIMVTKPLAEIVTDLTPLEAMYRGDLQDGSFQNEVHLWFLKWKKQKKNMDPVYFQTACLLPYLMPHLSSPTSGFFCVSCVPCQ